MKSIALLFLAFAGSLHAVQQIEVTSAFIDVPAGTEAPATPDKLGANKNADLLSAPRLIVAENKAGKIEVTQATPVPGGGSANLGLSVEVKTSVTEKGNIWFSGVITDRSRGGAQKTEKLETSSFAARELYFSGWTTNGGTAQLRTAAATTQVMKNDKPVVQSRELLVYLTFHKVNAEGERIAKPEKEAPTKKNPVKKAPAKPAKKK
jgi:type II secretory pathway component HofQ